MKSTHTYITPGDSVFVKLGGSYPHDCPPVIYIKVREQATFSGDVNIKPMVAYFPCLVAASSNNLVMIVWSHKGIIQFGWLPRHRIVMNAEDA